MAERLLGRLQWWERYVADNGGEMNNNPSPGNLAGGITTILEKSLGAVSKGGRSPLRAVYDYAEPVRQAGLVFMDTPGYDPVSATGQIAGGANLVCFTTGRGSVFGSKPVPTIKIATTTGLFERMQSDMDFDSGGIVAGSLSVGEAGERLFRLMLDVASGRRSRSGTTASANANSCRGCAARSCDGKGGVRPRAQSDSEGEPAMETSMSEPMIGATGRDDSLSELEKGLLGEALRLLAETRARALELCVEVSRRQGGAAPDVHDFNLPTIIELQRRFGTRSCPDGAGMAASGRFA